MPSRRSRLGATPTGRSQSNPGEALRTCLPTAEAKRLPLRQILGATIPFAVSLLTASSGSAAEFTDPLATIGVPMLCYRRDYSAEHLAQHARQTVKSVLLAFEGRALLTLVLTFRTGVTKQISAGCGWTSSGANTDTSGRKMIPAFNGSAAFECIVTVGDSAEEGGYLLVEPAHDANSVTVFVQSPITSDEVEYRKGRAYNLNLGSEDLTFKLTRIDAKSCAPFKAKKG